MFDIAQAMETGSSNATCFVSLSGVSRQIVLDALYTYIETWKWYPAVVDEDIAMAALDAAFDEVMTNVSTTPIGTLAMFAGATAPVGWLVCNGAYVEQAEYAELFSVVGTLYGATIGTKFALPDFRSRFALGYPGYGSVGTTGGNASVTLGAGNLPAHTHAVTASSGIPLYKFSGSGAGRNGLGVTAGLNAASVRLYVDDNTTANAPFLIIPPYVSTLFIIKALA